MVNWDDIGNVALAVISDLIVFYLGIGVLMLPVWLLGVVSRSDRLSRFGRGWWLLPLRVYLGALGRLDRLGSSTEAWHHSNFPPEPATEDERPASGPAPAVVWLLAIVGGFALFEIALRTVVDPIGDGSVGLLVAMATTVGAVVAGGYAWLTSDVETRGGGRRPLFTAAITIAIVLGMLSYSLFLEARSASRLVSDYCMYGAISEAQLHECKRHVTASHVKDLDTPAAEFAEGDSSAECGAGSGPFCDDAVNRRLVEDQAPPPDGRP